jgi:type II secretory pathway component GspD/PulD (secretin)/beta-lactamase regulating signal transducer with metallopeptidase domain/tetratricopeptide (TPR) repeat protein
MNRFTEFLNQPLILTLGWTLVHFLWQGIVLAGMLFLTQALLRSRSANSRYLAACFALLGMVIASLTTFAYLAKPSEPQSIHASLTASLYETVFTGPANAGLPPTRVTQISLSPQPQSLRSLLEASLPWLAGGWLAVVSALSLRLLIGYLRVRQLKRTAREAMGEAWDEKLARLAGLLKVSRPVRLCKSALVEVPTVIGWLRPVILFPAGILTKLSPAQLEAILTHELSHIRRHDYAINLLQNVVETLLFYHPAVWWVSKQISQERENCCDDISVKVCGNRVAYARALATLEELRSAPVELSLAADGGSLLRRIRRLLGLPPSSDRSGLWAAGTLAILTVAAVVLANRSTLWAANSQSRPAGVETAETIRPLLQIRLVAREGDASPVDELPGPFANSPRLRVLKEIYLDESDFEVPSARVQESPLDQRLEIGITLTEAGAEKFAHLTEQNIERQLAIIFDGSVLTAPIIKQRIPGRHITLSGSITKAEAESIVSKLNLASNAKSNGASTEAKSSASNDNAARLTHSLPSDSITAAGREGILRQADIIQLRRTIAEARKAQSQPDLAGSARLYEEALRLVQKVGVGVDQERNETANGMAVVRMQLANNAQKQGNFVEADQQVKAILRVDPANVAAQNFKKINDQELEEQKGKVASKEVEDLVPEIKAQRIATATLVQDARVLIEMGRFGDAEAKLKQAVKADPEHQGASYYLNYVQVARHAREAKQREITGNTGNTEKATFPESWNKAVFPEAPNFRQSKVTETNATSTLVQDARVLIEMGRFDDAEAKLKQAVKADPEHQGASYYLNYVQVARHAREAKQREITAREKMLQVEQSWNAPPRRDGQPLANPYAKTNLLKASPQRQRIHEKLNQIVLEEVLYDGIALSEVVKNLNEETRKRDPEKRGINFIINSQIITPASPSSNPSNTNTARPLPRPASLEPVDLNKVVIRINPALRNIRLADLLDAVTKVAEVPMRFSVEDYAIVFTQKFADESPQLFTRTFLVNPNTFFEALQKWSGGSVQGALGSFPSPRVDLSGGAALGLGGGGLGSGLGGGSGGLGSGGITFQEQKVNYSVMVREFFSTLGLNFPTNAPGGGGPGGGPGGFGGAAAPGGASQGNSMFFNERTGVLFVRASLEELDVIEKAIQTLNTTPPQVRLEKFADEPSQLHTRVYRLNPNTIIESLQRAGSGSVTGAGGIRLGDGLSGGGAGIAGGEPKLAYSTMFRQFFGTLGLHFPTNQVGSPAGDPRPAQTQALFYNERTGDLFVRASLGDLDAIEKAVQTLNIAPPQVRLEVKIAEITQADSKALGFDWLLGSTPTNGGAGSGTAPAFQGASTTANSSGVFPGVPPGAAPTPTADSPSARPPAPGTNNQQRIDGSKTNQIMATLTGTLTDAQYRVVLRALEQRGGVDILSAPSVSTLSGRPARISVTESKTIVESQNGASNSPALSTKVVEVGPSVDMTPIVSADGYSVQLAIDAKFIEFLGYDAPGKVFKPVEGGPPVTAKLPLPKFRLRQVVSNVDVRDGQTVVVGGLVAENIVKYKDKVPVLGDIPLIGRFFRSESQGTSKKNLLIFITPLIIDPAGNRVHAESDPSLIRTNAPALPSK